MADGTDLFSLLSSRYGIPTALQLLSLFNPSASATQRGFGAANLANTGLSALGYSPTIPLGGYNIPALPAGLAGAGLGYQLSQIAQDPNLSAGQKVGTGAVDTGAILASLYGPQAPYVAGILAASALGGQLQKSGSPQVRQLGQGISAPVNPVTNFLSVLSGTSSPVSAANRTVRQSEQLPIGAQIAMSAILPGVPTGKALEWLGLGTPPTTGTMFRNELGQVLKQIPSLKGLDLTKYNIDPNVYNALSPQAKQAGQQLGEILAAYAPSGKKDPNAYGIQAQNILLNAFGDKTPDILKQFIASQQPQTSTVASTAAPVSQAQAIGWQNPNSIAAIAKRLTAG